MKLESSAVAKLRELVAEEGNPDLMLRVFVQGGGWHRPPAAADQVSLSKP